MGDCLAEVQLRPHLGQFGVALVGQVEDEAGLLTTGAGPEEDLVLAGLLLFFLEDRVVGQLNVAFLLVKLTRDGRQVQSSNIGKELDLDFVDVGQLVARLVYTEVVRVALHDEDLFAVAVLRHPGRQHGPLGIVKLILLEVEELAPGLDARVGDRLVQVRLVGIVGMELLEVVRRQEHRVFLVAGILLGNFRKEERLWRVEGVLHRVIIYLLNQDRRSVLVQQPGWR